MILKQNFVKGRLNKDVDIRLLPKGEYRDAYGIEIINSEGSDVGAIEPMLSNKQLTNYDVGSNPLDMGNFSDEFRKKIYWFVLSDTGSFLFEWDDINKIQSLVLGDTRPEESRVFSLDKDHYITGIVKVTTQDVDGDLLLFTDDNMQPICINVERAKTYGINGFTEEDILLIKKPPRKAPKITPTYTNDGSNNIEERFLLFATRYRYLDGEYSAPSDFSNYNFTPKPFDLDYFTLDNLGMVNSFNAVKIDFNTGERQVTEIQLLVKESLSGTLYVIETFSKEKNGWSDNELKSFIFSNNKTITPLPSDQLLRSFDNVPLKAKALSLIENIPVFSNYVEGYDIKDADGNSINIDYNISVNTNSIDEGDDLDINIVNASSSQAEVSNPSNYPLNQGRRIVIDIETEINGVAGYRNSFFYTLDDDYTNVTGVFQSSEFISFLDVINADFQQNYNEEGNYSPPSNYVLQGDPRIFSLTAGGVAKLVINPIVFRDTDNNDAIVQIPVTFTQGTNFAITDSINSGTAKTNRNYEVGLVYMDKYGRRSTVLTSKNNTIFIPQEYSSFRNKLVSTINNPAPYWADRYKLVVKSNPLAYQTLYVTEFYSEDFFTWCKLEGNNKDKVSVGDFLIIKKAGQTVITDPIKIKVLEIQQKEDDFILNNTDPDGNDIIERAGVYMKIRPKSFSMNREDFDVKISEAPEGSSKSSFPITYLDLFTEGASPNFQELAIPSGTSLTLYFNSSRNYDSGWKNVTYDNQFFAQRNYNSIEEWFNEVIFSRTTLKADDGSEEFEFDYLPNLRMIRNSEGKLSLEVKGLLSGGSRNRRGRVEAKIIVRIGSGVYVFETLPKQADSDIFYETEQSFDIVDGNHKANMQDQNTTDRTPAIVEMDFFNCYTQGNGIESFRVRDEFNTNYLSVDTRPSSTSVEEYEEIRRFADQTYGKPFIESTDINGLNEFNLSTANFKELDKQYGSIQRTLSREGNLLILQEEKAGYVLFGKDILTSNNGESILSKVPEVLGSYVPYAGNNGIGKDPESLAVNNTRVNWINARRGTPIRLSVDGTTEINYGMVSYFRNLFIQNPTSRKIGANDPYFGKYVISIEDEISKTLNAFCGNIIRKTIDEAFTFILNINHLLGETVLNFNVTDGGVNIEAVYDNVFYNQDAVTNSASITIARTDLSLDKIQITITPVSETATIEATNVCPVGLPMKVISIVLGNESDLGTTIINRYRWGAGSFFSDEHLFEDFALSQFQVQEGLEGTSRFPERGKNVNIQAFKNSSTTGDFYANRQNRLGYLISSDEYGEADINTILSLATFPQTLESQISIDSSINQVSFPFDRPTGDENLYLIWDYQDKNFPPIASNDSFEVLAASETNFDVLANDSDAEGDNLEVIIVSQPQYGTVELNADKTIKYTHTGDTLQPDSFFYKLSDGVFESENAKVTISITANPPVAVDDSFNINKGATKNFNIIANDSNPDSQPLNIIIVTQPQFGTVNILTDNTIDYTHDNSNNFSDSFTYKLDDGFSESNVATVSLTVGVSAGDSITASGGTGVFLVPFIVGTDPGDLVIHFNAQGVPDRLEILFDVDNNPENYADAELMPVVADSLFVGDNILTDQNVPANGDVSSLDLNLYNGQTFDVVETGTQTISITDSIVASNVGNRTDAVPNGPSRNSSGNTQVGVQNLVFTSVSDTVGETGNNYADGNIALRYAKPASTAFVAYLRVSGTSGTAWNIYQTQFITE